MTGVDGVVWRGGLEREARDAALRLAVPLLDDVPEHGVALVFTATRVELQLGGATRTGPVWVELTGGQIARRVQEPGFSRSPLARAVGATKGRSPRVVDATAGLGTDAALLAHLGCDVLACERDVVVAELWRDAIRRGAPDGLRFAARDARVVLARLEPPPDVVYLDPMFPARSKRALVKKEMQLLQRVLHDGDDAAADDAQRDALDLLAHARAHAARVVVKRPKRAPPLMDDVGPQWPGSVTRFDVYLA